MYAAGNQMASPARAASTPFGRVFAEQAINQVEGQQILSDRWWSRDQQAMMLVTALQQFCPAGGEPGKICRFSQWGLQIVP